MRTAASRLFIPMLKKLKQIRRRLLKPGILSGVKVSGQGSPRLRRSDPQSEEMGVVLIRTGDDPGQGLKAVQGLWAAHLQGLFQPSDRILVKINLNSADPYPASTCPHMLKALLIFLGRQGLTNIKVGDCSGVRDLPTSGVVKRKGLARVLDGLAEMVCFDHEPWVRVPVEGRFLREVTLPRAVFEADGIISLANLKSHQLAGFSAGLKLNVGCMHPFERYALHQDHLEEKVAELSLALAPDLTIIDARQAMITGGPYQGRVESGGALIIGANPWHVDEAAYRLLVSLKRQYGCEPGFSEDPLASGQLRHWLELRLEPSFNRDYRFTEV